MIGISDREEEIEETTSFDKEKEGVWEWGVVIEEGKVCKEAWWEWEGEREGEREGEKEEVDREGFLINKEPLISDFSCLSLFILSTACLSRVWATSLAIYFTNSGGREIGVGVEREAVDRVGVEEDGWESKTLLAIWSANFSTKFSSIWTVDLYLDVEEWEENIEGLVGIGAPKSELAVKLRREG
jgi:hypothetical protein